MPVDRGVIEQQLHALGEGPRWWEQRELRDLPAALNEDESILAIARGKLQRPRWLRHSWLIVVTDDRLLCLNSTKRGRHQIEVAADHITRVWSGMGPFRGRVVILAGREKYRLIVQRTDAFKLLTALSGLVQTAPPVAQGPWPTMMAGRVFRHILALPTVALQPEAPSKPALPPSQVSEERLQQLEDQVQRLQNQIEFLEQLLQQRHGALKSE